MMGKISIICAKIIIFEVYKIWKKPSGPLLEKKMYNINPTKTGGKPIRELKKSKTNFFPLKLFTTHNRAMGKPNKQAKKSANKDIFNDKKTISNKSEFTSKISLKEFIVRLVISSIKNS